MFVVAECGSKDVNRMRHPHVEEKWQQVVNLMAEAFEMPAGFIARYTGTACSEWQTNPEVSKDGFNT
jgi:hypothetical protein